MSLALAVLRPEPGAAATVARIEAEGRRAVRLPLFAVRAVPWGTPKSADYDALLATSANAFRHGGPDLAQLRALPVHAVGAATAAAARAAGFTVARTGERDMAALLPALAGMRVLRLAGREHRPAPDLDTRIVYAADALSPDLSPLADAVALLHSPRAAARLATLARDRARIAIAAISPAARAAAGSGWRAAAIAPAPTDDALVSAAIALADELTLPGGGRIEGA